MDKKTTGIIGVAVLVLIAVAAYLTLAQPQEVPESPSETTPATESADTTTQEDTTQEEPDTAAGNTQTSQPPTAIAQTNVRVIVDQTNLKNDMVQYDQLVQDLNGYRIQIDNCAADNFELQVKSGTQLMLDGFSPDPARVTVGDTAVILQGYDARLITLQSDIADEVTITCENTEGTQYNIATIAVQP